LKRSLLNVASKSFPPNHIHQKSIDTKLTNVSKPFIRKPKSNNETSQNHIPGSVIHNRKQSTSSNQKISLTKPSAAASMKPTMKITSVKPKSILSAIQQVSPIKKNIQNRTIKENMIANQRPNVNGTAPGTQLRSRTIAKPPKPIQTKTSLLRSKSETFISALSENEYHVEEKMMKDTPTTKQTGSLWACGQNIA
jgi:hypothetical protein